MDESRLGVLFWKWRFLLLTR